MTRLVFVEDRPGFVDAFQAEALSLVPVYEGRAGMALVRLASSGLLTVDLALPGDAGYRCVTSLGGAAGADVPVLAIVGCDQATRETAIGSRLLAFVRRDRALRLGHMTGWPSAFGLPSREFDRLMTVVRRCGRFTTQPERQYVLTVRTVGFLAAGEAPPADLAAYGDAWHATQFAIARDSTMEHRAIA